MINRQPPDSNNPPPDLLGQIAAETGMTPGALLGRPELAATPGADLLAAAREAEMLDMRPLPEYTLDYAEWLLDEYEALALALPTPDESDLIGLLKAYCQLGDTDTARSMIDRVPMYRDVALANVAQGYIRNGKVEQGLALIDAVTQQYKDFFRFEVIKELVSQDGGIKIARSLSDDVTVRNYKIKVGAIMAKVGDRTILDDPLLLRHLASTESTDLEKLEYYQALLAAGETARAQNQVEAWQWSGENSSNRATALATIAGAYAAKGDLEQALKLAAETPSNAMGQPYAYILIAKALSTQGLFDEAKTLTDQHDLSDESDVKAGLVYAYAHNGRFDEADRMVARLPEASRSTYHGLIINIAANSGFLSEAVARIEKIDNAESKAEMYTETAIAVAKRARGIEV